jgi:3-oxoacyl-[acyl-carrier protein] reductase
MAAWRSEFRPSRVPLFAAGRPLAREASGLDPLPSVISGSLRASKLDAGGRPDTVATHCRTLNGLTLAEHTNRVALVTGASRGVGASTALLLAARGYDIVVNYHSKRSRAEEIASSVRALGRRALVGQADLTIGSEVASMVESVRVEFHHINVLILNASGGLEKGKPPDYAMRLNLEAQVRVVDCSLPLMPSGSRIVFVTSHMAHFYAAKGMTGPYEPVAASKYAGEQALLARRWEFVKLGLGLVVVSGDMIEGTITPRLLERMDRGMTRARREQVGALPTVEEFARAITDAATSAELANSTIFVGNKD